MSNNKVDSSTTTTSSTFSDLTTKSSTPTKHVAKFHLLPQDDYVTIPEDLFIYSGFLREYKKGMLNDKFCRNIEYTRHNYGPGSSAKRVPSSIDIRNSNGQKNGNTVSNNKSNKCRTQDDIAVGRSPEKSSSGTWSKLPDWAHGWFSALDKDILISTANVAGFLTATPFVEHYANFLAVKQQLEDNNSKWTATPTTGSNNIKWTSTPTTGSNNIKWTSTPTTGQQQQLDNNNIATQWEAEWTSNWIGGR
uniref:Uncharacterized protein n=1 Tax=Meloidogyne hapla TaxID=6305 RepID=A0A1I8BN99_MELHA